jgi:transposase
MPCVAEVIGNICWDWIELILALMPVSSVNARKRLVQGGGEQLLLDALLALCKQRGWLKAQERQRTDSTHVLAKIRAMNRLMCVGEALRFVLTSLAVVVPDWLLEQSDAEWVERYGQRIEENRLPKSEADRLAPLRA